MSMSAAAKKCRCRTYTPQRRRGTGLRQKDDGGVGGPPSDVMDLRPVNLDSKNDRCRTYTPDGRRGTGLRQKDDGVGLTSRPQGLAGRMRSTSRRNYRCRTYTPYPWSIRANDTALRQPVRTCLSRYWLIYISLGKGEHCSAPLSEESNPIRQPRDGCWFH
jgi:hypothetical protein